MTEYNDAEDPSTCLGSYWIDSPFFLSYIL